jgi:hypothetical protein
MEGLRDSLPMLLPDIDTLEYSLVPGRLIVWLGTIYSHVPKTDQKIRDVERREVHYIRTGRMRQPKRRGVIQARKD